MGVLLKQILQTVIEIFRISFQHVCDCDNRVGALPGYQQLALGLTRKEAEGITSGFLREACFVCILNSF